MSDDATRRTLPPPQANEFPPPNFPTVFADGVLSLVNSRTTVKYFLARFEPSFIGDGRSQMQAFAQVVMPMDGFAMMFVFFEAQIRVLVENGYITEEHLNELRAIFRGDQRT
jgi:hypothetical protein